MKTSLNLMLSVFLVLLPLKVLGKGFICQDEKQTSLKAVEIEIAKNVRRAAYFGKTTWIDLEYDSSPRSQEYVFLGSERSLDDVMIIFKKNDLVAIKVNAQGPAFVFKCKEIPRDDFSHL
jgi:hypothetical protein